MKTALIYVNSNFGVGHFQRCSCILQALEARYPDVNPVLLFGGLPCSIFDGLHRTTKVELPGLTFQRADDLVGFEPAPMEDGQSVEDVLRRRQELISEAVRFLEVDVVMLEYFPFSKQYLLPEVDHLLAEIRRTSSPTVVSSVRDFVTVDDGFDMELAEAFSVQEQLQIFAHSDPDMATLQDSLPLPSLLEDRIRYTGYVVDPLFLVGNLSQKKRVMAVGVGGGRDGGPLVGMFMDALRKVDSRVLGDYEIRVFPGLFFPNNLMQDLLQSVEDLRDYNLRVCAFSDYRTTLSECSVSISMCGYNTAVELLASGVPEIWLFPRRRTEQMLRANMLRRRGLARCISGPEELVEMLGEIHRLPSPQPSPKIEVDFGGAERTAEMLRSLAGGGS